MMKTLLVIPKYYDTESGGRFYEMPLGIAYINAALRKANVDLECLKMNHIENKDIYEELKQVIITKNIGIILCGTITPFFPIIKKIFAAAKEANPDIITVAGGGAVTSEPLVFAEASGVDYGIIGEGEISDVELVQTLVNGGDVSKVKGIVYKTENGYKLTEPREVIEDLDTIEFPCYEGFDVEKYLDIQNISHTYYTYYVDKPRIMPMTLARSCPYQCKFCFHPVGNRYRTRSLDNFFAELDQLIEKYNINGIIILDELFSASVERVYEFCARIKPYNLHWLVQMRVDIITEELLRVMRDAGCYTISYGLESFSPTVLKNMRKNIKAEDVENALSLTWDAGIDIQGNFIFGDELETRHTFYETLSWWFKHPKYSINLAMIETYPGTGYYRELVKSGKLTDERKFLENGNFNINLTGMNQEEYMRMIIAIRILYYYYNPIVATILRLEENNDGQIVFEFKCPHCGKVNTYIGIDPRIFANKIFRLGCRNCNHRNVFYSVEPKSLPNYEKLEYLCRMMENARDEHDFNIAYDNLVDGYMSVRDNDNPFPI